MNEIEILAALVGFPSVVGTNNNAIVDWISSYAKSVGADVSVLTGPEGDRANLLMSIGPRNVPGYVLSGHTDVVPAQEAEWVTDPFKLHRAGDRLYGRGTTDMKGFLACALAALPMLASMALKRPVHLAFSYDEEAGCRGVPHLLKALPDLCAKPVGAIIGEPSQMQPVRAHKGKAAARLEIIGRSGHSSRPDLGWNAVHAMAGVISKAVVYGRSLETGPADTDFEPASSTLQFGVISGGQAVNIIPDRCTADIEVRTIPDVSAIALLEPVKAELYTLRDKGFDVLWHPLSAYPAFAISDQNPLAELMVALTGQQTVAAVSYGTEAGLFQQAGIDAIICGPGNISRAHRPNEYIELAEMQACKQMIEGLAAHLVS
jgi:acetylornithine deacetylase